MTNRNKDHDPPAIGSLAVPLFLIVVLCGVAGQSGCAAKTAWTDPGLSYEPKEFRSVLRQRAPNLCRDMHRAPFEISKQTRMLARDKLSAAAPGSDPVWELIALLSEPKPQGLELVYDWSVSANAKQTLQLGRGDCVALATVLVGLGRSLGWPIYFAEARTENPIIHEFEELTVLSGHMVVIVLSQEGRVVVDFLGLVDNDAYDIRPIDDLTAYAHLINNVAGHKVINGEGGGSLESWQAAQAGFKLATQIQPNLGRAWNNLGISYTRLDQLDAARSAYERAIELDTIFGSPARNLTIMETRALNGTTLLDQTTF